MVVCLVWGADLHMAQWIPLPLTVSCSSKIQIGFTFLVPAHLGSPGKGPLNEVRLTRIVPHRGPLNGCVCVWLIHRQTDGLAPECRQWQLPTISSNSCYAQQRSPTGSMHNNNNRHVLVKTCVGSTVMQSVPVSSCPFSEYISSARRRIVDATSSTVFTTNN